MTDEACPGHHSDPERTGRYFGRLGTLDAEGWLRRLFWYYDAACRARFITAFEEGYRDGAAWREKKQRRKAAKRAARSAAWNPIEVNGDD